MTTSAHLEPYRERINKAYMDYSYEENQHASLFDALTPVLAEIIAAAEQAAHRRALQSRSFAPPPSLASEARLDAERVSVRSSQRKGRLMMSPQEATKLVGRVVLKDGINFTVTQACSPGGWIHVWNPTTQTITVFDSLELFDNWAYGKPIKSGS